jgi:hypothetical protein
MGDDVVCTFINLVLFGVTLTIILRELFRGRKHGQE